MSDEQQIWVEVNGKHVQLAINTNAIGANDASDINIVPYYTEMLHWVLTLLCTKAPCDFRLHEYGYILFMGTTDKAVIKQVRDVIPLLEKIAIVEPDADFMRISIQLKAEHRR